MQHTVVCAGATDSAEAQLSARQSKHNNTRYRVRCTIQSNRRWPIEPVNGSKQSGKYKTFIFCSLHATMALPQTPSDFLKEELRAREKERRHSSRSSQSKTSERKQPFLNAKDIIALCVGAAAVAVVALWVSDCIGLSFE